jgi:hypothetical protein
MDITIDYPFLSKVYLELIKNEQFKTQFQAKAPTIYADIESTHINPNCTCRAKVEAYVRTNKEKLHEFLLDFINTNQTGLTLQQIEEKYKTTPYTGKVDKVKITEWAEYVNGLGKVKATFRHFSTARVDDEYINVFFI